MVRSSRAFVMEAMGAVVDELERGAEKPGPETTKIARLACVHATNVCMHAVDLLHNTAGTSGMRMDSPLERKFRERMAAPTTDGFRIRSMRTSEESSLASSLLPKWQGTDWRSCPA